MDELKQEYSELHIDLVNLIANLRVASRHVQIAEAFISSSSERERTLRLDLTARTSLTTGLHIAIPIIARLIAVAEAAKEPIERRNPELAQNALTIQ